MKLAILGGSYNPLHIGHLMLADAAARQFGYDTVAFIPAFLSPFKKAHCGCTAEDRITMITGALADAAGFYCETCEIERGGLSYTYDTLQFLYKKYTNIEGKIGLILGDDLLTDFHKWKNAELIPDYADLLIGTRCEAAYRVKEWCTGLFGEKNYSLIENAYLPISSTQIRTAIAEKKAWRYLVPPFVYGYIKTHALYE
ncbi:MAG: nicotinate (nicotinamide) nucleotide adenylyltransferase [Treponema sp.]